MSVKPTPKNLDGLVMTDDLAKVLRKIDDDLYEAIRNAHAAVTDAIPAEYSWVVTPLMYHWFTEGVAGAAIPDLLDKYGRAATRIDERNKKNKNKKAGETTEVKKGGKVNQEGDESEEASDNEESDDEGSDDEGSEGDNLRQCLAREKEINAALRNVTTATPKKRKRQEGTEGSSAKKTTRTSLFDAISRNTTAPTPTVPATSMQSAGKSKKVKKQE